MQPKAAETANCHHIWVKCELMTLGGMIRDDDECIRCYKTRTEIMLSREIRPESE